MNETTIFLAQLWGPIIAVLGIGVLMSRSYYMRVYRNLQNETLALMFASITLMAVGIAQVLAHNEWDSADAIFISLIGWATLVKGVVLAVFPSAVDRFGDRIVQNTTFFTVAAAAAVLLGGYLTTVGYF